MLSGVPEFGRLVHWLERLRADGHCDLLACCLPFQVDGELTEYGLKVRGLALHRWRTGLLAEKKQRIPRRRAKEINAELREVNVLESRLKELFAWQRQVCRGKDCPPGHPLFLEADLAAEVRRRLKMLRPGLDGVTQWLACIVAWWCGLPALDRFLEALHRFPTEENCEDISQLKAASSQFEVVAKRSSDEKTRRLRLEIRETLNRLPEQLKSDAKLSWRMHGRTLRDYCLLMKERSETEIALRREARYRRCPVLLSALCLIDRSEIRIPERVIQEAVLQREVTSCRALTEGLAELSREPGYDLLLKNLDLIAPASLSRLQKLLAEGESVDDLDWAARQKLIDMEWNAVLTPGWARRFFEMLARRGVDYSEGRIRSVLMWFETVDECQLLREFGTWFERTPDVRLPPRQAAQVRQLIEKFVIPVICQYRFHEMLRNWMRQSQRERVSAPGVSLKAELRRSLSGIAHFRRLAGENEVLPESWRRELARPARAASELTWLRRQVESGTATTQMHSRLQNLMTRLEFVDQDRLLRKTQRAFLSAAIESMRKCLRRESIEAWKSAAGFVCEEITDRFPLLFGLWVCAMNEQQRSMLREILEAWQQYGGDYRRHLADNQRWLNRPSCRTMNLDEWLRPEPEWVEVTPDTRIRIEASLEPIQTFLMGQHFGSCLSLNDCNRMSALTNTYDANKQVLYIYNEDGSLLGRQLVTISSAGTMLGYHCYLKVSTRDEKLRQVLTSLIHGFCGRWARRCGVRLGDEGEPDSIAGHFWYDDGEIDWPDSAKEIAGGDRSSLSLFRRFFADRS